MFNEHDDEFFVFISRFVRFFSVFFFFIYLKMAMRELSFYFIWNYMFCSYAESFSVGSYCFGIVIENDSSQCCFVSLEMKPSGTESQQWNDLQWINCLIVRLYIVRPMNVLNDPKIAGIITTVNVIKTVTHN